MTSKPSSADIADAPTQEAEHELGLTPPSSTQPEASKLELFLPTKAPPQTEPALAPRAGSTVPGAEAASTGLRSARLLNVSSGHAIVQIRGEIEPREVALDADVDAVIVREALENGDRVMVESNEDGEPVLVGVLRCRQPDKLRLSAAVVEIEADREILLRSGKGALRIREDGDIELVGSRISAASRGLFRLVGKMLRLN